MQKKGFPVDAMTFDDGAMTKSEAAAFLKVHPLTIERMTNRGAIASFKIGRARRWRLSALRDFVARAEEQDALRVRDKSGNREDAPRQTIAA
jgi:excisionase family DNA binding protein